MLNTIEARLQAILDTLNTDIKKVRVFDINSLERADKNIYDHEVITVVYRENPSPLPDIGGADRLIRASFQVLALEREKAIVQTLFNEFFKDNNNTLINDRWVTFTNITSTGQADNSGVHIFQRWEVGMTILVIHNITNIKDILVTINSVEYTIANGMFSYNFEVVNKYGEHPTSQYMTLRKTGIEQVLSIGILDLPGNELRKALYQDTDIVSISITDDTNTISFNGRVARIVKAAQPKAFPTIIATIRRG